MLSLASPYISIWERLFISNELQWYLKYLTFCTISDLTIQLTLHLHKSDTNRTSFQPILHFGILICVDHRQTIYLSDPTRNSKQGTQTQTFKSKKSKPIAYNQEPITILVPKSNARPKPKRKTRENHNQRRRKGAWEKTRKQPYWCGHNIHIKMSHAIVRSFSRRYLFANSLYWHALMGKTECNWQSSETSRIQPRNKCNQTGLKQERNCMEGGETKKKKQKL